LFSAAAWIFSMDSGPLLLSTRKAVHIYLVASSTSSRMYCRPLGVASVMGPHKLQCTSSSGLSTLYFAYLGKRVHRCLVVMPSVMGPHKLQCTSSSGLSALYFAYLGKGARRCLVVMQTSHSCSM
jgi:hypothetical protein